VGVSITVDTTVPQRPTVDLTDADDTGRSELDNVTMGDPTQGDGIVDVRITSDPGTTIDIKDGNTVIVAGLPVGPTGEIFVTLDLNVLAGVSGFPAEGPHPFSVEATDVAGNIRQSEQLLVTVDFTPAAKPTLALQVASDTLPIGDGVTSIMSPSFAGVGAPNETVRLYANGELVGSAVINTSGTWEITSLPLNEDNYVFTAETEDQAGNVSPLSDPVALTVAPNYGFRVDPITRAVTVYGEDAVADVITLSINGAGTRVVIDWAQPGLGLAGSQQFPVPGTPAIRVITFGGDDQLVVDNTNGMLDVPDGIFYDGGAGQDSMLLTGATAVDTITYNPGPAVDGGVITHQLGAAVQKVSFAGLEPIDDLVAGAMVVNGTPQSDVISVYEDAPGVGVTINDYEGIEIGNKTSLTINGGVGHDTIDLNNIAVPAALNGAITVDGGLGNDTLLGSAGDDLLLGGPGDDLIRGNDGDDTLRGHEGDDVLEGGLGDDDLNGGPGGDVLDGGAGDDLATFIATDADNDVTMDPTQVVIDQDVNTISNVEHVVIETRGGDDAVELLASDGTPGQVDLLGGNDDDAFTVDLANPAPNSLINVDGGPQAAADSATVIGRPGDDQFTMYGNANVFGDAWVNLIDIEDPHVLEGRQVDTDPDTVEVTKYPFTDADGNDSFVKLAGAGAVEVYRDIYNGRAADIDSLVLVGTTYKGSRVTVGVKKAKGTDNETSIGSITGRGTGAKSIQAPRSDLVGSGVELSGAAGNLRFDDIVDGADILLGGDSGQRLRLKADQVGNVNLTTGGIIASATVNGWVAGTLTGSVLQSVVSNGFFGADLVNLRVNRVGYGVKKLAVKNGHLVTTITGDRVKAVNVLKGNAMVNAILTTDAITLDGRTAFDALSIRGGDLLGLNVQMAPGTLMRKLSVLPLGGNGGNVTGAVNLTGSLGSAVIGRGVNTAGWNIGEQLGNLTVKRTVQGTVGPAAIRTGGGMGTVKVGAVNQVDFQAGINPAAGRTATNPGDFLTLETIGAFKVTGLPGRPKPRFMTDSNVSAASLGTSNLRNVQFADSGLYVLGAGGDEIGKITYKDTTDPTQNWTYPPKPGQVFGGPGGFINIA